MSIERFEDLEVWKDAMRLTTDIYRSLRECRDYGLRNQMQRAAVSIASNIAEGFERQGNREFIQFLYIAKGSAGELRTQVYLATRLEIIEKSTCEEFIQRSEKISRMLGGLIKTRKEKFS